MEENTPSPETIQKSDKLSLVRNLLRAFVAMLIVWVFLQSQHPVFVVPKEYAIEMGSPPEKVEALRVQQARADRMNAMLDVGVLGGVLAAAMALGSSACCPAVVRLLVAIPWGAAVGAFAGFLASNAQAKSAGTLPTVSDTIQVQVIMFAALGAGLGLMVGGFARSARPALSGAVAGAIAGALAGMAYPITAAILMASASTEPVVPEGAPLRLLWLGLFTGCVSLIVPLVVRPESPVAGSKTQQTN